MVAIKPKIITRIMESQKTKNRLAYEFNNHIATINRWLESNDAMLTTRTALIAISEELELTEEEILQA